MKKCVKTTTYVNSNQTKEIITLCRIKKVIHIRWQNSLLTRNCFFICKCPILTLGKRAGMYIDPHRTFNIILLTAICRKFSTSNSLCSPSSTSNKSCILNRFCSVNSFVWGTPLFTITCLYDSRTSLCHCGRLLHFI